LKRNLIFQKLSEPLSIKSLIFNRKFLMQHKSIVTFAFLVTVSSSIFASNGGSVGDRVINALAAPLQKNRMLAAAVSGVLLYKCVLKPLYEEVSYRLPITRAQEDAAVIEQKNRDAVKKYYFARSYDDSTKIYSPKSYSRERSIPADVQAVFAAQRTVAVAQANLVAVSSQVTIPEGVSFWTSRKDIDYKR